MPKLRRYQPIFVKTNRNLTETSRTKLESPVLTDTYRGNDAIRQTRAHKKFWDSYLYIIEHQTKTIHIYLLGNDEKLYSQLKKSRNRPQGDVTYGGGDPFERLIDYKVVAYRYKAFLPKKLIVSEIWDEMNPESSFYGGRLGGSGKYEFTSRGAWAQYHSDGVGTNDIAILVNYSKEDYLAG